MTTTNVRKTAADLKQLAKVIFALIEVEGLDMSIHIAPMVDTYLNNEVDFEYSVEKDSFFKDEEDFYEKINFVGVTEKRILELINEHLFEAI